MPNIFTTFFSKKTVQQSLIVSVMFAVVLAIWGGLFITNLGAKSIPDYDMHFGNTYSLATGQFNRNTHMITPDYGMGKENSFANNQQKKKTTVVTGTEQELSTKGLHNEVVWRLISSPLKQDPNIAVQKAKLRDGNKSATFGVRTQYPQINWLPQAIGLKLGMFFNKTAYGQLQTARIMNLVFYIVLVISAIWLVPKGKVLVALISALPTAVYLASSLSSDMFGYEIVLLFLACVMRISSQERLVSRVQLVILVILVILFFQIKVAYLPIVLVLFAVDRRVISWGRKVAVVLTGAIIGGGFYMLWSRAHSIVLLNTDPAVMKDYLTHNPLLFLYNVIVNIGAIPSQLSALPVSYTLITLAILLYLLWSLPHQSFQQTELFWDTVYANRFAILAFVTAFASLGMTYSALFLTWTPLSGTTVQTIEGFQGRYLLPLLPLLVVLYHSTPISKKNEVSEKI